MDEYNREHYRRLQEEIRRAWEDLEYAHTWLVASDWDEDTSIDDKLASAQNKARVYTELVDRAAWTLRRG